MIGSKRFLSWGVILSGSLVLLGTLTGAQAQTNLRLAHASSTNSLIHDAVKRFAADVKDRSKGQLTVTLFPDGQLGDEGPIAEGVGNGSIDVGLGGVIDAIDPKLGVVTLPFLFADAKAAHAFLDGPVGKSVFAAGAERGYKMLGALDSGFRQFATSARPIKTPADLRNLKIRTPPNPVILATIQELGALPQAVPFGEVYTALQSKVVDGVEPEMRDFWDQKWYESAKFLSISNYIWTPNYWFMNKSRYDKLTPEQRAALDAAVAATTAWYRDQLDAVYADVQAKLKQKGVQINEVDGAPFRNLVDPVYTKFGKEWGAEYVDKVRKAASGS
jgi:tripartite ATP-independent transporter DctP family solute receptor